MMTLYHGTNCDIDHFDASMSQPYNVGVHFGTRAAAVARIDYRMALSPSLRDYCTDEVHQKYFLDFEGKALSLPCKFLPSRALLEQHRMRLVK